jgi:hypothetical protein
MRAVNRRLRALEAAQPSRISPAVKAWLGWPLTDAERARLDDPVPEPVMSTLPQEVREWLAIG